MWLDAVLMHAPTKHLARAIGAVAQEPRWVEIEAFLRAFDHAPCGKNFGLSDRCRRFDIDDDRILDVEQIVGRIGKEGLPAMGSGPACRRISRRDELGNDLGGGAE